MSNNSAGVEEFQTQHTSNHKEHREHKEKADQAQVGSFFAFFVISVVKNQATFGTTGGRQRWLRRRSNSWRAAASITSRRQQEGKLKIGRSIIRWSLPT